MATSQQNIIIDIDAKSGKATKAIGDVDERVRQLGDSEVDTTQKASKFGTIATGVMTGVGIAITTKVINALHRVGTAITDSLNVVGEFQSSMGQIAVATDAPAEKLVELSDLAKQLGADSIFSANEAATAMLELAKGGLSPAAIQAGALKSAIDLAAASGMGLAEASNTIVSAMNTFGIKAEDVGKAVDALAGAANASSADVSDLTEALSQVGNGAVNAGFDLNDTAAALAAFADNGIKGSDAGTSLKTMLQRLVPQTAKAKKAMEEYGLSFVDANGNIDDMEVIAGKLQDKLLNLSEAERIRALSTIFGSDATRAASVFMRQGAEGMQAYLKATEDVGAAQEMADARMSGWSGTVEKLSGSFETLQLAIGEKLAAAITPATNSLGFLFDKMAASITNSAAFTNAVNAINVAMKPFTDALESGASFSEAFAQAFTKLNTLTGGGLNNILQLANAFSPLQIAFKAIQPSLPALQGAFTSIMGAIGPIVPIITQVSSAISGALGTAIQRLIPVIIQLVNGMAPVINAIMNMVNTLLPPLMELLTPIIDLVLSIVEAVAPLITTLMDALVPVINILTTIIGSVIQAITPLIEFIVQLVQMILPPLVAIIQNVTNWFGWLAEMISQVVNQIMTVLQPMLDWLGNLWNSILDGAKNIWNNIVAFFQDVPGSIMNAINALGELPGKAAEWFMGVLTAAQDKFWEVVEFVKTIPQKVIDALGNIGNMLKDSGKKLIDGFLSGIKSAWDNLTGWVKKGMDNLRGLWPFSPAKWGPFSGHGYVTFSGKALTEDFQDSLVAGIHKATAATSLAMGELQTTISPAVSWTNPSAPMPSLPPIELSAAERGITAELMREAMAGMTLNAHFDNPDDLSNGVSARIVLENRRI